VWRREGFVFLLLKAMFLEAPNPSGIILGTWCDRGLLLEMIRCKKKYICLLRSCLPSCWRARRRRREAIELANNGEEAERATFCALLLLQPPASQPERERAATFADSETFSLSPRHFFPPLRLIPCSPPMLVSPATAHSHAFEMTAKRSFRLEKWRMSLSGPLHILHSPPQLDDGDVFLLLQAGDEGKWRHLWRF